MTTRWDALVRELGGRGDALLYLADRVLDRASGGRARVVKYHVVAQPIGRAGAYAVLRDDGRTRIEPAPPSHPCVADFPRPPAVVARRYRDGAQCLVATVGAAFAGFLWWQSHRYDEDEVRCRYELADAARSVWDFDVHVEPRWRLGRTLARLWAEADRRLAAQGIEWSFSRISAFNRASLAAHSRLGARRCASAVFVVLGPLQLSWLAGADGARAAWPRWSIGERGKPRLVLAPPATTAPSTALPARAPLVSDEPRPARR